MLSLTCILLIIILKVRIEALILEVKEEEIILQYLMISRQQELQVISNQFQPEDPLCPLRATDNLNIHQSIKLSIHILVQTYLNNIK